MAEPAANGKSGKVVIRNVGLMLSWQWRTSEHHHALAEQNLYAADMLLAQAALEQDNIGHAEEILRRYLPVSGEKDLRGWEWRYAWRQCQGDELFSLGWGDLPTFSLALSPDGSLLASGTLCRVIIWDLEHRRPKRYLDFTNVITALAFGRNNAEVAIGTQEGEVVLWRSEKWARLTGPADYFIRGLAASPVGKLLAVYGRNSLRLVNLGRYRRADPCR